MPDATPHLGLPYIAAAQAQKYVTHNEALHVLDSIVQLAVLDRDLAAPPASPTEGDRYLVAASATGDWAGQEGRIGAYLDGAWTFMAPQAGWVCFVLDEAVLIYFDGAAWTSPPVGAITALQTLALLGIGTTADATNPFSAKLNKALWTAKTAAEGGDGDLRYTMNKETAGDTVSLLFQDGYSGRAEVGLIGDDNLTFKVSADGSAWTVALAIDKTTGIVSPLALSLGTGAPSASFPLALGFTTNGVSGFSVTNSSGGSSAQIQNKLVNNIGSLAYYGITSSGFSGYAPINGGRIFFGGNGAPVVLLTQDANDLIFCTSGAERFRIQNAGPVTPGADNTQSLGSASKRWSVVYAGTGTINTSDAAEKKLRGPLTEAELCAWGQVQWIVYRWIEAIDSKGEDGARLHVGTTAQVVRDAFIAEGLDPARYALFCADPLMRRVTRTRTERRAATEETAEAPVFGDVEVDYEAEEPVTDPTTGEPVMRLGLRYDQCLAMEAAWQRSRVAALEARVAALEAKQTPNRRESQTNAPRW